MAFVVVDNVWWARTERIRTLAGFPFTIDFHHVENRPVYQESAARALHLKELGLNISTIAHRLNVEHKTVVKAVEWTGPIDRLK